MQFARPLSPAKRAPDHARAGESGTAIILVTHELPDIVPEIQRVVLMKAGRIVADGAKDEILQVDRLTALFGVDLEMSRRDGHYNLW